MGSVSDDLDSLALERLLLLDNLLKKKQLLAEYLKNGFFQLGKSRYSLGCHAVSAMRIPESSIRASVRTTAILQTAKECQDAVGSFSFKVRDVVNTDVATTEEGKTVGEVAAAHGNDEEQLHQKITEDLDELSEKVDRTCIDEDFDDKSKEETVDTLDLEENKLANTKPINWFSALPPQSLRQAQKSFESSIQLAASCVSLQAQLLALEQHYRNITLQQDVTPPGEKC